MFHLLSGRSKVCRKRWTQEMDKSELSLPNRLSKVLLELVELTRIEPVTS